MAPSIEDMARALSANHWRTLNSHHKDVVSRVLSKIREGKEIPQYDISTVVNLFLEYEVNAQCNG